MSQGDAFDEVAEIPIEAVVSAEVKPANKRASAKRPRTSKEDECIELALKYVSNAYQSENIEFVCVCIPSRNNTSLYGPFVFDNNVSFKIFGGNATFYCFSRASSGLIPAGSRTLPENNTYFEISAKLEIKE